MIYVDPAPVGYPGFGFRGGNGRVKRLQRAQCISGNGLKLNSFYAEF